MAKILFVHGMRMQNRSPETIHRSWSMDLRSLLKDTEKRRPRGISLPSDDDIELAYWADLFVPEKPGDDAAMKGLDIPALRAAYYAVLRGAVLATDWMVGHNKDGRPTNPVAQMVDHIVYQSAVYMNNGPVYHPDPNVGDGAFHQVQARFRKALKDDTRIVIAHSLGSVVAYEALCRGPHPVQTLFTIGSPIATPNLIFEPMRRRLRQTFGSSIDEALPSVGTRKWVNVYAAQDVWCVPIKKLAPIFDKDIEDIEVQQGSPSAAVDTHKLSTYLTQPKLGDAIADALLAADS